VKKDDWQEIRRIYDEAIELSPDARSEYLDQACAGNEALRSEVEKLLESDDDYLIERSIQESCEQPQLLTAGQTFSHYEIIRQLGSGGMGEVYLAMDLKLDRKVAVKILNDTFGKHEGNLQRFLQEAKAASSLNHPNVLIIHEVGENAEGHFIVSEFIDGKTLRQFMQDVPLDLSQILDISIQAANGLAAAHGVGLIHRDIKPENIMVRPDGYVKILDFGLAKLVEKRNRSFIGLNDETTRRNDTAKGIILGTVNYMSPEQAKSEKVDERTDIFSLGTVIYEMVTGRSPFKADTMSETFANLIRTEPLPVSRFATNVPDELQRIVSKMLRKNKDERYQTAKDVLNDLKDLKREIELRPSGANTEFPVRENATERMTSPMTVDTTSGKAGAGGKTWLVVATVLGLIAVGLITVWYLSNRKPADEPSLVTRATQITTWTGLDAFPSVSFNGNTVAFSSNRTGSFEIYVKQLISGAREVQLTTDGGQNFEPAFSPDGSLIAYHSKQKGGIWVVPVSGGSAKQVSDFGSRPAWSPDGTRLVFQSFPLTDLGFNASNAMPPSVLWIVSAKGGEPKRITEPGNPPGGHGTPSFSPDGKRIVFDSSDFNGGNVWSISADGGDAKKVADTAQDPVYAPDGKAIYMVGRGGQNGNRFVERVTLNGSNEPVGDPVKIFDASGTVMRQISIDAKAKRLFYSSLSTASNICSTSLSRRADPPGPEAVAMTQNANIRTLSPAFSPDGTKIAYQTFGTGIDSQIWMMDSNGENKVQLTTNGGLGPWWFPDGRHLSFRSIGEDGRLSLGSVSVEGSTEKKLLDFDADVSYFRVSPDGKQVVYQSKKDGISNFWLQPIGGGTPRQLTFDNESVSFPAWSRDGKWIAFQLTRGEDSQVGVVSSEGGEVVQLTSKKGQNWVYDWAPDNDRILFAGQRDGIWNVYSISRTTREEKQLTHFTKLNGYVRYPAWSPNNDKIVYECAETTGNIWMLELK